MTCILQKLDSTNNWVTQASTTELAFVTSGTNACRLTVNFISTDTFWTGAAPNLNQQRTVYDYRIGVQDTNLLAATPGVYAVYDDLQLVIQASCYTDVFSLTTFLPDVVQTIYPIVQGDGSFGTTAISSTAATHTAGCPASYWLEIFDEASKQWIDYNSDANKATKWPFV